MELYFFEYHHRTLIDVTVNDMYLHNKKGTGYIQSPPHLRLHVILMLSIPSFLLLVNPYLLHGCIGGVPLQYLPFPLR